MSDQDLMNEVPTPRKSDVDTQNRRGSNAVTMINNQPGKTYDLRRSIDNGNNQARQIIVYEPNNRDVLMSVIEEEKELTEIAGDFDPNVSKPQ